MFTDIISSEISIRLQKSSSVCDHWRKCLGWVQGVLKNYVF